MNWEQVKRNWNRAKGPLQSRFLNDGWRICRGDGVHRSLLVDTIA
jgi:hypothetical protein